MHTYTFFLEKMPILLKCVCLIHNCYVIVRTCTFYDKMYTLFNIRIYIMLMYHYIPVGHQDECNINREGLLTLGIAVISIGRV